ncbi:hypothetical protein GCM10027589_05840 [Actinocorallia lasiicapitis]
MEIHIDPDGLEAPYLQLARILRDKIANGEIPLGKRIPSLPELEQATGLARNTVYRAVSVLREEGLIKAAPGRGSFVVKLPGNPTG